MLSPTNNRRENTFSWDDPGGPLYCSQRKNSTYGDMALSTTLYIKEESRGNQIKKYTYNITCKCINISYDL